MDKDLSISIRDQLRYAWEERYRLKGRQWGNAPAYPPQLVGSGVVLELGVGDGKNLRSLSHGEVLLIGADFSRSALKLCQADPLLAGISLLLADGCDLPVRSASIHQVFAHHVLGHVQDRYCQIILDELYRVLLPGGVAEITVFASGDMREGKGTEVEPGVYIRGDGIITRYFHREDLEMLFHRFSVCDIRLDEWKMRIRGIEYTRAEYVATLQKIVK